MLNWVFIFAFLVVMGAYVYWMLRKYRKAYERTGATELPRREGSSGLLPGSPSGGSDRDDRRRD